MLGFRAAGLAQINFHDVEVPSVNIVGKSGFALSHIAPVGLQYGRISTACSAAGLLRGCFEESISYAATRKVANQTVGNIGMIRSMIAKMGTDLQAARFLCYAACRAEDEHLPESFSKTLIAKYHSSRAAVRAASDAVQIRGASGCHESSPVARYYRDAKLMEILEGTTQIHEHILGRYSWTRPASLRPDYLNMDATASRAATKADLEKIAQFNRTEKAFPDNATIQELIEVQIEKHSSETAVICEHDKVFGVPSLTYGQLNERVNQLAHLLRSKGAEPDQIIGIMVERSFSMIIGVLGIIKAGAAYLPISPDNPEDRIDYMLKDGGVKLLLVQNKTANKIKFGGVIINLEALEIYQGSTGNPVIMNKPEDLAYVIYTSGSTGKPKGRDDRASLRHQSPELDAKRLSHRREGRDFAKDALLLRCVGVGTVLVGIPWSQTLLFGPGR